MTGSVSGAQLRAFIERIERLEEEKRTIADGIKEVKAEAKGCGFDLPTINAILKLRKKDQAERDEEQAMLDLYMSALGMLPLFESEAVPSYSQSGLSYAGEKGRGFVAKLTDEQMAAALAYDGEDSPVGELTDNQDQIGGNGTDLPVEASTDKQAAGASRPTNSNSAAHSPAERAGEAPSSSQASPATHSDDIDLTIPAFLRRDEGRGYPKREAGAV